MGWRKSIFQQNFEYEWDIWFYKVTQLKKNIENLDQNIFP